MCKELFEQETEEALRRIRIDCVGAESDTVIKESPIKKQSIWPDYSILQMSPQKPNEKPVVIKRTRLKVKKKK